MMKTATLGSTTTTYGYDADGLRKIKSSGSTTKYDIHGLRSQLLAEYDVSTGVPAIFLDCRAIPLRPRQAVVKMRPDAITRTANDVSEIIEEFVAGTGHERAWDDFLSLSIEDPELDAIRLQCNQIDSAYPPDRPGRFCNDAGAERLRGIALRLRTRAGK